QAPAATAGSGTVLVVDDEPLIRSLARDILKRYGYEVIIAEGGAQAVEMYRQFGEQISVVLLDMVMPEMDGREVFRSIRELDPAAKIIVSSGYSHDRDADYLLEQGAAGFVQKPYRMVELANALSEVLAR
ncbi:MAG TPA: hybrid sensor histidine kinase/response regulator, partial [Nitrospiraceae bacterium]|nr:hybrid sensor histidine kinase/response regulator [Nitrospiraceae bacterium]